MRRARLINSSGVGMAKRRIAAVVTRENPFCLRAPSRTSKMRLSDYRDNEKSCVWQALNATAVIREAEDLAAGYIARRAALTRETKGRRTSSASRIARSRR